MTILPASSIAYEPNTAPVDAELPTGLRSNAHLDPITIDLALDSPPRLDVPSTLDVQLTPVWDDYDAVTVTVTVPDGVDVEDSQRQVPLAVGETTAIQFSVTPRSTGTYLIQVRAAAGPLESDDQGYRQVYLDVPAAGKGDTHVDHLPVSTYTVPAVPVDGEPSFKTLGTAAEPSGAVPSADVDTPGRPFPPSRSPHTEDPGPQSEGSGDALVAAASTFQVTACWGYRAEDDTTYLRQRWATARVMDSDSIDDDLLWSGLTDSNGCFTSDPIPREEECCLKGNQDVYIQFRACHGAICVKNSGGTVYDSFTPTETVGSQTLWNRGNWAPPSTELYAWRPFQYANNGWDYAVNHVDHPSSSLGLLDIKIPSATNSCTNDGPACVVRADATMYLKADGIRDKRPDIVGHEYGHWLQWEAYGESYWPSGGGAHSLCSDNQNRGLSWAEGFATYFGTKADQQIYPTNGATGDAFYTSTSANNIDTGFCSGVDGDDNEWNVATTLWDLTDSVTDGEDNVQESDDNVHKALRACDDFALRDYYDGGGVSPNSSTCNWTTQVPGKECSFVKAAWQSNIEDFNDLPVTTVTSQNSFAWVRDTVTLSASVTDECTPDSTEFRVSTNSSCTTSDTLVGTDTTSPYSMTYNTNLRTDGTSLWTCARALDTLGSNNWGSFDASGSSMRIDNTDPIASASHTCAFPGNSGWCRSTTYTRTLTASDATSGIGSISCFDSVSVSCGTATVTAGQGSRGLSVFATDLAGNTDSDTDIVKIDSGNPTVSASASCPVSLVGGWCPSASYTGSLTASDSVSGISSTSCKINGATVSCGTSSRTSGDGTHSLTVTAFDVAGNSASASASIPVDATPPAVTASHSCSFAGNNGWCRSTSYTRTLTASDATSGLASLTCSDGGTVSCGSAFVSGASQGSHSMSVSATDVAGHSASASATVKVDSVNPSGSISTPSGLQIGTYTVSYGASDGTSGLGSIAVQERHATIGGAFSTVCSSSFSGSSSTSGGCTRTLTDPLLPGEYCYRLVVTDLAGNSYTTSESCVTKV